MSLFTPMRLLRIIFICSLFFYFLQATRNPDDWHFIDSVNLIIHEAGHVFLMPFGETLQFLGGSIFQIFIPLVFAAAFALRRDWFSSACVLLWVGYSMTNVSVYIGDAIEQKLPLLGNGLHDWNTLLTMHHLLNQTHLIATSVFVIGHIILWIGLIIGLLSALTSADAVSSS